MKFWNRKWKGGQSAVELAIALPVMILLLLAGGDFARFCYYAITVSNAARAGAQYGSEGLAAAADSAGMKTAAATDASNLQISSSAKVCSCCSSSVGNLNCTGTTATACGSSAGDCADNPNGNYIEVDTSVPFTTTITYPGIPSSLTLTGKAVMLVQQQ
jgi:Flp pilus assembly protein TadG